MNTRLQDAKDAMMIAYYDWQDNGASEYFRNKFFEAQALVKTLKGEE